MSGPYRRPPDVAFVERADPDGRTVVELAVLPDGPVAHLEGSAAVIWREAIRDDDADLVGRVAARTGANAGEIADDVRTFLGELVEQRLLVLGGSEA